MDHFADVEIRRSARRRKTISARVEGDTLVVMVPSGLSRQAEERYVREMAERLAARRERRRPTDVELHDRARVLSRRYLDGEAVPTSVRWVTNQSTRWGSCTPSTRAIRLSHRLQEMPDYVVDYVLTHELVHLLVPGHGPRFHALMDRYPQAERARGYLEGWAGRSGEEWDEDDLDEGAAGPDGEGGSAAGA